MPALSFRIHLAPEETKVRLLSCILLAVLALVPAFGSVITTHPVVGNWNAAVTALGATVVYSENFNDNTVNAPFLSVENTVGSPAGFQWSRVGNFGDRIDPSNAGSWTTWTFTSSFASIGWYATFDTTPGGSGTGIDIYAFTPDEGWKFAISVPTNVTSTFIGFTVDTNFSALQFRPGQLAGVAETYFMDDMNYAGGVPEPGTLGLLGLGLVAAGLGKRFRR